MKGRENILREHTFLLLRHINGAVNSLPMEGFPQDGVVNFPPLEGVDCEVGRGGSSTAENLPKERGYLLYFLRIIYHVFNNPST